MSNEPLLDRRASCDAGNPSAAAVSPVREGSLERLHELGGERLVGQLIEIFRTNGGEHVDRMREASASGDHQGVARAAHALISTAGNLGAERLQALSTDLARNASLAAPVVPARVAELALEYERVRDWLERQ